MRFRKNGKFEDKTVRRKGHFIHIEKHSGKSIGQTAVLNIAAVFICITALWSVFIHYQTRLGREYNELMQDNLSSYVKAQTVEVNSFHSDVSGTLNAIRSLAETEGAGISGGKLQDYLDTVNKEQSRYSVLYMTLDEFAESAAGAEADRAEKDRIYALLRAGQEVITDVNRKEEYADYRYSIAVPLFGRPGDISGVLCTVADAQELVDTSWKSGDIDVVSSCVVKSDGSFVPLRDSDKQLQPTLEKELKEKKVSGDILVQIEQALAQDKDIFVGALNRKTDKGYYIGISPLGYNDWYIVDFVKENKIYVHSSMLMNQMLQTSMVVLAMIVFAAGMIMWYMITKRRKESLEAKKYMVLAQFSDTIMFQYTYSADTAVISPNAELKFRVNHLESSRYLKENKNLMELHLDDEKMFQDILKTPHNDGEIHAVNMRLVDKCGRYIWCECQYRYVYDGNHPSAVIGKLTDINSQIKREQQLLKKVRLDGLTEIYNKAAGEEIIRRKMAKSRKGLLYILDVDNFKQINDQYGHCQGDKALAHIGGLLKSKFRSDDIVCRIGGDEFVAYMDGTVNRKAAAKKAEDIFKALEECSQEMDFEITVSIGIAACPEHGSTYEELFNAADKAMYEGKKHGKNQFQIGGNEIL